MYPCPLINCSIPMYDDEWHKNKSCALWKLDDEQRFDYYEAIEDAKSAKYKAKIEFYSNQQKDEENIDQSKEDLIKHGRFFFYDTIVPLNSNLKIEPDLITEEDIFDDYEEEQYDEDYFGFNQFEDDNVNLSNINIINHSLKFFQQQSLVHNKSAVSDHFFFDSNDDQDNELLVNLFKEIKIDKTSSKSTYNQYSIVNIINDKLNQQNKKDQYQQAVMDLQNRIKYITNSDVYNIYIDEFLKNYPDYIKPRSYFEAFDNIEFTHNSYINELFNFNDNYKDLKVPKSKTRFKIVYLTSGGGKTTLSKQHKMYLDIDAFIARHYNKFKIVESFCIKYKDYSLMSLFFKHSFFIDVDFLQNKIILCNHPNQIPNQFRLGYNEMVLIPQQLNWDVRFFNENYFSLLAIQGKIKYFADYDNYNKIIFNHFIKFKDKMKISNNMYELI